MSHESVDHNPVNIENNGFIEELSGAVDQAFSLRKIVSIAEGHKNESYLDYLEDKSRGIYNSEDPRSQRVIAEGNRVVVQDLEDYGELLKLAFRKTVSDQEEASEVASDALNGFKQQTVINPVTEEVQYLIDFIETEDGITGLSTKAFTMKKYLSQSPEFQELNVQPKRRIDFVSQSDPKYQYVVDAGIVSDLRGANLCWLGTTDLALSVFVPDSDTRDSILKKVVADIYDPDYFDSTGALRSDMYGGLVEELNNELSSQNIPVRAVVHDEIVFNDLADKQRDGSVLIFGLSDGPGSTHLMVMTEILKEEGDRVFFQVYNSGSKDIIAGSKITDNYTIHDDHINDRFNVHHQLITINQIENG